MDQLELECFRVGEIDFPLVPASPFRDWMDAFSDRHAYRCLPLSIANTHAWHILSPCHLEVTWNGGDKVKDLTLRSAEMSDEELKHVAVSNFSRGVLTFHVGFLFRTSPGWGIITTGPSNEPKDGIYPLTGCIETDWLPYPFTMNWQMTRPGTVVFEKGEPICSIMPVLKAGIESFEPKIYELTDDPILEYEQNAFKEERDRFNKKLAQKDPDAQKRAWQKHYFTGRMPDGSKMEGHKNKLRLSDPVDCTGQKPALALEKARVDLGSIKEEDVKNDPPAIGCPMHKDKEDESKTRKPRIYTIKLKKEEPKPNSPGKKWSEDSFMNNIPLEQSEQNIKGRENIVDGQLVNPPKLHIDEVTPEKKSGFDFMINDNFLMPEQCKTLMRALDESQEIMDSRDLKNDFWQGRVLYLPDMHKAHPEAAQIIIDVMRKETEHIEKFYKLNQKIYCNTINLVRWPEGKFMLAHADNANPDGSPHGMPFRDFSSICYLNDDYEGGNVYFTNLDTTIRPRTGRNLTFTGGFYHEHGVLKVTKGHRYSLAAFFTFDEKHKDEWIYNKG